MRINIKMEKQLTEEEKQKIKRSNKRIRIMLVIAALLVIGYYLVKWFILKKPGLFGW